MVVRGERREARGERQEARGEMDSHKSHERGTTGDSQFKGIKGVQLAIASENARCFRVFRGGICARPKNTYWERKWQIENP